MIIPIEDRILLAETEVSTTNSGLIVPDLGREKCQFGKVINVGTGKYTIGGSHIPIS